MSPYCALLLTLIAAGVFPALAQDTTYSDPAGQFTATIPAGWSDESTLNMVCSRMSGVSIYLISVEGDDIQASIDAQSRGSLRTIVDAAQTPMGEFSAPSGTWTQVIYSLPGGQVGNAVAQSNGSATVVLLVTADSMAAMQAILADANAILASVSIEGSQRPPQTPETEAPPQCPRQQGEITFPELTGLTRSVASTTSGATTAAMKPTRRRKAIRVSCGCGYGIPPRPTADSEIAPLPAGQR